MEQHHEAESLVREPLHDDHPTPTDFLEQSLLWSMQDNYISLIRQALPGLDSGKTPIGQRIEALSQNFKYAVYLSGPACFSMQPEQLQLTAMPPLEEVDMGGAPTRVCPPGRRSAGGGSHFPHRRCLGCGLRRLCSSRPMNPDGQGTRHYRAVCSSWNTINLSWSGPLIRLTCSGWARLSSCWPKARAEDRRIFIFGNGGSAATASHFATDIVKGASYGRAKRFRIMALTDSLPTVTAYSNDVSYECMFAGTVEEFRRTGRCGDRGERFGQFAQRAARQWIMLTRSAAKPSR